MRASFSNTYNSDKLLYVCISRILSRYITLTCTLDIKFDINASICYSLSNNPFYNTGACDLYSLNKTRMRSLFFFSCIMSERKSAAMFIHERR